MSSAVNKIKDALHIGADKDQAPSKSRGASQFGNTHTTSYGTAQNDLTSSHGDKTRAATGQYNTPCTGVGNDSTCGTGLGRGNQLDPRIDTSNDAQYTNTQHSRNTHGNVAKTPGGALHASNTVPYESSLLNKIDPRVEYGSLGSSHNRTPGGVYNTEGNTMTGSGAEYQSSGTHSSHIANKLDPRVDASRQPSRNTDGVRHV